MTMTIDDDDVSVSSNLIQSNPQTFQPNPSDNTGLQNIYTKTIQWIQFNRKHVWIC